MSEIQPTVTATISVELLVAIVTSVAVIVAAIVPRFSSKDRRARLQSDLDILDRLEKNSEARATLKASIERRVIATSDTDATTRDWAGVTIGMLFLVLGMILLPFVSSLGGWWLALHVVTAFLLFFGVFGTVSSAIKKPRDEKGNAIKKPSVSRSQQE